MNGLCPFVTFAFDVAQFFLNLIFLLPNLIGITTPNLTSGLGSVFGCNL
jgi:hypothetical protein